MIYKSHKVSAIDQSTINAAVLHVGRRGGRDSRSITSQRFRVNILSVGKVVRRVGNPLTRLSSNCDETHQNQDIDNVEKG